MIACFTLVLEIGFLTVLHSLGWQMDNASASLMILLFTFTFFLTVERNGLLKRYKAQILLGYFLRIGLLYFDLFANRFFVLPNSGADADMFYNYAVRYMNYGGSTRTFYPVIMGSVFKLIGINRLYGQFLSMLSSIAALCIFVYIIKELNICDETATKVIGIVMLLPNAAILSSLFLREAIACMLITISIYMLALWMKRKSEFYFLLAILFSLPAALLHSGIIGIPVSYLIIRLLYDKYNNRIRLRFTNVVASLALVLIFTYVFSNYRNVSDALLSKMMNVDSLEDIANTNDTAGSSYAAYVGNSNSIANMIVYTFPRLLYFLFSPFPWQWRGVNDIITFFFSSLFYLVAITSVISYIKRNNRDNDAALLSFFMIALITTFIFGWGVSNAGTAARHRDKLFTIYGIIWALSTDGIPARHTLTFRGEILI